MDFSKFDYKKILESEKLTTQYLYSISLEKRITDEDYKAILSDDPISNFIQTAKMNMLVLLTKKEQQTLLAINMEFIPKIEEFLDKFEELKKELEDNIGVMETEDQIISYSCNLFSEVINEMFVLYAGFIRKLPAPLFKKIVVTYLENGIDLEELLKLSLQGQNNLPHIDDIIKNTSDQQVKNMLILLKNTPPNHREDICKMLGVELPNINFGD